MPDGSFNATLEPEVADAPATSAPKQKDPREISTIAFPYHTLADAVETARLILDKGGVPMSRDQLAGAMGLQGSSGNFTNKTAATRMFGLMETVSGKYQLTRLGFDILDPDDGARVKSAKAQAFLNVPLYRRVFEEFRNTQLPPRPLGLENAFVSFGVAAKQKTKARRAFDNSARLAGYFEHGNDKLIPPVIVPDTEKPKIDRDHDVRSGRTLKGDEGHDGEASADNHFIQGLLDELPAKIGDKWGHAERCKWLQLAGQCFDILFKPEENDTVVVKTVLVRHPAGRGKKVE